MKEGLTTTLHLVTLKLALDTVCSGQSSHTIPKLMDLIFVTHFGFTVVGLITLKFFTNDYLFDLKNTTLTGKVVQSLALFAFLDVLCL